MITGINGLRVGKSKCSQFLRLFCKKLLYIPYPGEQIWGYDLYLSNWGEVLLGTYRVLKWILLGACLGNSDHQ